MNENMTHDTAELLIETGRDLAKAKIDNDNKFVVHNHEGRPYVKRGWERLLEAEAETLRVTTLSGLNDFLTNNPDGLELEKLMVHVVDQETVAVRSIPYGPHKQRPVFMRATALVPDHMFSSATRPSYHSPEQFIPYLQSCFVETTGDHLKDVIKVCGNVCTSAEVQQEDDGMKQNVTTRAGVVTKEKTEVPNPVLLYPFSTFTEVAQPGRKMTLRFRGGDGGAGAALIEADGGAWKITAMQSIANWLRENLPEEVKVIA